MDTVIGAPTRSIRGRRRAVGIVATIAVLGFLAGCTPAETPRPTPTGTPEPTASATPSPTPTPTPTADAIAPPERPADMERTDEVGAVAAATYVTDLFVYVMQTGDLEEWDAISAGDCGWCTSVHADITDVYGDGGRYEGVQVSYGEPTFIAKDPTLGVSAVEVPFEAGTARAVTSDGTVERELAASNGFLLVDLIPTADGWQLLSGGARDASVDG